MFAVIKEFDTHALEVTLIADRPSLLTWITAHDPLTVVELEDPVVEAVGHDPRSVYAETYWTGCLGPTAILLLRRLASWLDASPDGFPLPLAPLARELGLGDATGRNSPVVRSVARLVELNMAQVRGDMLAVRRALPPLARRHERRLPGHLAARHRAELEAVAVAEPGARPLTATVVDARSWGSAGRPPGRVRDRSSLIGPAPAPNSPDGRSAA